MKNLNFEKDPDGRWYVILPEWEGDREALEMVMGADTMLDIIAQGENLVNVNVSEDPFKDAKFILTLKNYEAGGANYHLTSKLYNFDIWLCEVTAFVFGFLPKILYIS